MRSRASGWLGLGLLLAGVGLIAGIHLWHVTRTFVPLDIPVSLSRGRIQTGEFLINHDAIYRGHHRIRSLVRLRPSRLRAAPLCREVACRRAGQPSATEFRIRKSVERIQNGCYLGGLSAESGRYELDVDVLSDSGSLNALKPHLHIEAYWGAYLETEEIVDYLSLWGAAFALVGASLLCLSSFSTRKASPSVLLLQIAAPRGARIRSGGAIFRWCRCPECCRLRATRTRCSGQCCYFLCGRVFRSWGTDSRNSGAADSPWRHRGEYRPARDRAARVCGSQRFGLLKLKARACRRHCLPRSSMSWRAAAIGQSTSRAIRVPRLAR